MEATAVWRRESEEWMTRMGRTVGHSSVRTSMPEKRGCSVAARAMAARRLAMKAGPEEPEAPEARRPPKPAKEVGREKRVRA